MKKPRYLKQGRFRTKSDILLIHLKNAKENALTSNEILDKNHVPNPNFDIRDRVRLHSLMKHLKKRRLIKISKIKRPEIIQREYNAYRRNKNDFFPNHMCLFTLTKKGKKYIEEGFLTKQTIKKIKQGEIKLLKEQKEAFGKYIK